MADRGYMSIDDILATEERVACVFEIDAQGLGYLSDRVEGDELKRGSRVELPFWLASQLAVRKMAKIELPTFFGRSLKSKLLSAPASVNLSDRCPFFFELGLRLALLVRDQDIQDTLQRALQARFGEIVRRSPVHQSQDFGAFLAKLSNVERALFDLKSGAMRDRQDWLRQRSSSLLPNSRKRALA